MEMIEVTVTSEAEEESEPEDAAAEPSQVQE